MYSCSIETYVRQLDAYDTYALVPLISGPCRVIAGLVQLIMGSLLALISAIYGYANDAGLYNEATKNNVEELRYGIGHMFHGTLAFIWGVGNALRNCATGLGHPTMKNP